MKGERQSNVAPLRTATLTEPYISNGTTAVSYVAETTAASVGERISSLDEESVVFAPKNKISAWQGRLFVWIAAAIYGTNFAMVKLIDQGGMPLSASAAVRFSIAAVACTSMTSLVMMRNDDQKEDMLDVDAALGGLEVGAWYWAGYIFQAYGLQSVDAGESAFLNALSVVVVPVLDTIFYKRNLKPKKVASIGMAIGGMALLEWGQDVTDFLFGTAAESSSVVAAATATGGDSSAGLVYCLAQALMFGIGYWRLESVSAKFPDKSDVLTVFQVWGVAIGSILYWILHDSSTVGMIQDYLTNPFLVCNLLWTGLISTALALYLETAALTSISASELTLIMTSIGVFGSIFAYVSLGEVLSYEGMFGGALIVLACVLSTWSDE